MATKMLRVPAEAVLALASKQHGVVSRSQLVELGMTPGAIRHGLARGKLHRLRPGVYAVGRPDGGERGHWMAAVLACGPHALLSHRSAAALLGLRKEAPETIEVVVPADVVRRPAGIRVYRRVPTPAQSGAADGDRHARVLRPWVFDEIPVTAVAVVLVDLATCVEDFELEAAVSEADHRNLIKPKTLRLAIDGLGRRPGAVRLRNLLDATAYELTTTKLEHLFRALAQDAGLPRPQTQAQLGRSRVDFYWPELGLIVEAEASSTTALRSPRPPTHGATTRTPQEA